jgi:NAD(P)-dependent dehydrogenase (short-subunit alcohol dehydrogenase family)
MDMTGRRCVVTGANTGIGFAIATALAGRGATVVLVCRNPERGEAAAAAIRDRTGNRDVTLERCDLSDLAAVRACAGALRTAHPRIDVLVNNAGLYLPRRQVTPDGHELMLAVNHLAPFLMTGLLLDRLDGGRVVTTSSGAHAIARMDVADLDAARRYAPLRQYGLTKLANILFTRELARRAPQVVATCFHPGAVGSEFGQDEAGWLRLGMRIVKRFMRTPERGADAGIWLATAPEAASLSGAYVVDRRVCTPRGQGTDDALAAALWNESVRRVGLESMHLRA